MRRILKFLVVHLSRLLLLVLLGSILAAAAEGGRYHEAPMLAEQVRAGKLPPVEERLPDKPVVVKPIHAIGKYGGTWRRLTSSPFDNLMNQRLGYEPLVRWDRTGTKIIPNLAESWEIKQGGRVYVFHLQKGVKWSDGHPFTSADIMFWNDDVLWNKEITLFFPSTLAPTRNKFRVKATGPYTVEFHFDRPNGIFLELQATRGHFFWYPKHYMKQFHKDYVGKEKVEQLARETGATSWEDVFYQKSCPHRNKERPVLTPWKLAVTPPVTRMVCVRNPYYWKVDPEGNQLPYIDEIAFLVLPNGEVLNLRAVQGGTDMQSRMINPANYTLLMENRRKGGYRVLPDVNTSTTCVFINNHSKDPALRPILQDRRFRIALSVSVNRKEIVDLLYGGALAVPSRAVGCREDPHYLPEFGRKHIQYDPELANRLLDEMGMKRGPLGMRRMPDGKPLRPILTCRSSETGAGPELWGLVAEYWREAGLNFIVKNVAGSLLSLQSRSGSIDFYAYNNSGLHWIAAPLWYVPVSASAYYAPLYGKHYFTGGKKGIAPSAEFKRILDWYTRLSESADPNRKLELGRKILSQWADECYAIGIVRLKQLTIVSNRFKNVPDHIIHSYMIMTPGYLHPEQFYLEE